MENYLDPLVGICNSNMFGVSVLFYKRGVMLDKELKIQALALATQFPSDKDEAFALYKTLGDLLGGWLHTDPGDAENEAYLSSESVDK